MKYKFLVILIVAIVSTLTAQEFSFEDLIGEWEGEITSETYFEWNSPTTINVEQNGFYTDSSGILMPTIYPNTQEVRYDVETNRIHFKYLQTVYAGQYTYQHNFFELISYNGNDLEMHYNFWDDPEPQPQVMTITLSRVNDIQYGVVTGSVFDSISLTPLANVNINFGENSTSTDMYGSYSLDLMVGTYQAEINHPGFQETIVSNIYISANETITTNFGLQHLLNPPSDLNYQVEDNNLVMNWTIPVGINLTGYKLYKNDELIDSIMNNNYSYSEITPGEYSFYVTALYGEFESTPSNIINVQIQQPTSNSTEVAELTSELFDNYPNPFNPSTTISFNLKDNSHVNLSIYDLRGRKVAELLDKELSMGKHLYEWNGKSIDNKTLASGIYFYTLKANGTSITKKMIMQK